MLIQGQLMGKIHIFPPKREQPCKYETSETWDNPKSIKNRQKKIPFLNLLGYITH